MNKQNILDKIKDARKAHFLWINRIERLIENVLVGEELIDLDPHESEFGYWLYEDIEKCKSFPFLNEVLILIEEEHLKLHAIYFEIYRIYFVETKRTALASLFFGTRKEIEAHKEIEAMSHYNHLLDGSARLMKQLNNFERKVKISSDTIINQCLAV